MANVLLTTSCNRSCPYCFARQEMNDTPDTGLLSWDNLIYVTDFLLASGQHRVSLLGGEPTLHPQCLDYILYLLERGLEVTVFTNGIVDGQRLKDFEQHLQTISPERLSFICNLNDPATAPDSAANRSLIEEFLSALGPWTSPGFNIYRKDFSLGFLFDAINRYGMRRHLRLGVAHPAPGGPTAFIAPKDMPEVMDRLYAHRDLFDTLRVVPGLDCGFPACLFSDERLGWLHRFPGEVHFRCGPAVDIAPDMSVYYCFPLSKVMRRSLFEFDSMLDVEAHFARLRGLFKAELAGIFPECDGCRRQEDGVCGGGGLCQILYRFAGEAPVRLAEILDGLPSDRMSL